jgi:acylphosphatase
MVQARSYRIRGRVQGVGYRYFTQQIALALGVRGWVRNLPNGDVEAHGEAQNDVLVRFRAELERGPSFSQVSEVIEEDAPANGRVTSFEIRG